MHGGLVILMFGLALAVFWSGFLRVGAQSALLLAPLSARRPAHRLERRSARPLTR